MKKMSRNFSMSSVSLGKSVHSRVTTDPGLQRSLQGELKLRRGKEWWQGSFLGNTALL